MQIICDSKKFYVSISCWRKRIKIGELKLIDPYLPEEMQLAVHYGRVWVEGSYS